MATVNFRAGALALTEEITNGTPVKPTNSSDFLSIQPDISKDPGQETLENEEMRNNIISSKKITGNQSPTFSMSHYFRANKGNLPGYNLLMKNGFGSVKQVAVETTVSSAASQRVFDAVDASEYEKGDFLLLQLPTGNELRPIESVSGNTITLAFETANPITNGALIGKSITYQALNDMSTVPTLSSWFYLPGTLEVISGMRVEGIDINFAAGELINASYSASGTQFYFNPLAITASNKYIDVDVSATEYSASIPEKLYSDPHEVAEALENSLNANGSGVVYAVSYGDDGKFTITGDAAFTLLGATGTNVANSILPTIAFDAVDSAAQTSHVSQNQIDLTSGLTPTYDDADPISARGHILLLGDYTSTECKDASSVDFSLANTANKLLSICPESGIKDIAISERSITASLELYLEQYDARYFKALRTGDKLPFFYGAGEKSGGQFVKGSCACLYISHASVDSLSITDDNGTAKISIDLSAYAPEDSTQPAFVGFV